MSSPHEDSAPQRHVAEQGFAAWIAQINDKRRAPLFEALNLLQEDLNEQDRAFTGALIELDWVRDQIGSPEHILGSEKTKHGEIAEIAEVGIRRARDVLQGESPNAFWNAADRLSADDYGIGGVPVQSKFINGINNGLRHVIEHAERYPSYGTDDGAYYHIPSDQYSAVQEILDGKTNGFNSRTVRAIEEKVQRLEELKSRSFDDLIRPASHEYADVQQGKIHQTIDLHESDIDTENKGIRQGIVEDHRENVEAAQESASPTLGGMSKAAATGAAVGAGLQLTLAVYEKWKRDDTLPTQFTQADWKEIGFGALSEAAAGGVSAAALYGLTNYSALSAPYAGAVVSSGRAMSKLTDQYRTGTISFDEYTDLSLIATTEAGIAAAGAALGQAVIPIPVLGAVIGSSTAKLASAHAKHLLEDQSDAYAQRIEAQLQEQFASLDDKHRTLLARFDAEMIRLGDLTSAAFDLESNAFLLLLSSARLAEAHGVAEDQIIETSDDVDAYILGASQAQSTIAE